MTRTSFFTRGKKRDLQDIVDVVAAAVVDVVIVFVTFVKDYSKMIDNTIVVCILYI